MTNFPHASNPDPCPLRTPFKSQRSPSTKINNLSEDTKGTSLMAVLVKKVKKDILSVMKFHSHLLKLVDEIDGPIESS